MSPTLRLKIGVIGATGAVGTEFIKMLSERKFPLEELRVFASDASKGSRIAFRDQILTVRGLEAECFEGLDIAFFSSGDDISKEWAPQAVRSGAIAIDNSAAFRMNPEIPLVVPEVNGHLLASNRGPQLIANPNCSTIQLVVALAPIRQTFGLKEVRVASYQSVSGAGKLGVEELQNQTMAVMNHKPTTPQVFPHTIAFNNIPQIGSFDENGFSTEENKIMNETRKIMDMPGLKISAFAVRTPTLNSHSEAVWFTTERDATRSEMINLMKRSPGIVVVDDPASNAYPTNLSASGTDPVYVGRIHQDPNDNRLWMMWVVADNIRKGAALNGIQIAEQIFNLERS